MKRNLDLGLLVLRLSVGILMLLHGLAKLSGLGFIKGMLSEAGLPAFIAYGVYLGEIVAPILIIVGYRTRLVSVVYIVNVLVAIFLVHANDIFTLNQHGGWGIELLGLYLFGAVALFLTGAGRLSISSGHKWD
ncbi:DoxX family protein [Carboxylicivirga sp. RSCT41]|uniref:DoxX family protein n=1 Tax=Carboxylicivirga agarovorans TaxID=3417570 RepID=UPI003D3337B1